MDGTTNGQEMDQMTVGTIRLDKGKYSIVSEIKPAIKQMLLNSDFEFIVYNKLNCVEILCVKIN